MAICETRVKNLAFFCPPHPNGSGFPVGAALFTKLEYLILNHLRKHVARLRLMSAVRDAYCFGAEGRPR
jgi:hypothetical protein